jgi:DNA-binding SARP family transcriptional activator/tetratricopeptide (TPR) repeat protein
MVIAAQDGPLRFGVLGPLQVVDAAGITWPVRAAKQRVMLAALLLGSGATISAASMSEALWDACPPANAPAVMRTYLMRLRRALGPAGARVVTRPRGWAAELHGPEECDLSQVEQLWRTARGAAEGKDWTRASALLGEALGYWRGEPLADVPSVVLARREAARLSELRLHLAEARIDADLRLGRHAELVMELRRLTGEHPLREHLRVLLMLACYRSGQQAAALEVYRDAHRTLARELGVAPGPELQQMHQRILVADRDLSVARDGDVRLLGQSPARDGATLAGSHGAAESGTVRVPLTVPRQIPAGTRHFAGRVEELRALTAIIDGAGSATAVVISAVSGTAGVGKTALAVHWAHQMADRFPEGQLYADLRGWGPGAGPASPADLISRFLDSLGVPADQVPASTGARQDLYRSLLAGKRMLVVLDNARDAEQVRPLLPGSSCVVLITSRSRLASLVAAEAAYPLSLDVLTAAEARELLALRLGADRVGAEPDAADELAELCARLPLALAIAACRTALQPGMPLAVLADELRDASARLAALDAGDGVSLEAAFSWSYDYLPRPARTMFRLLGVHPGPDITVAAAASLAAVSPAQAGAILRQLTAASLVSEHLPGRYRFHDLLRGYAAGCADAEDSQQSRRAAIHRALDHYLHSAHAADQMLGKLPASITLGPPHPGVAPELPGDFRQAMAWFEAEQQVLAAVVDLAASTGFDVHGWQLPMTLGGFFDRKRHTGSSLAVQQAALDAALRLGDRHAQAQVHRHIGSACRDLGAYQEAEHHYQQALALGQELGDCADQAHTHLAASLVLDHQRRYREALQNALRSLALSERAGDRALQAVALNNVGWFHVRLGDYRLALAYCRRAISIHQDVGNRYSEGRAWDSVGYAQHHLGQHAEAISSYQRALTLVRQEGGRIDEAAILGRLGDAHEADGKPHLAAQARQQAQAILDHR